jgi:hypothetical protein
VLSVSQVTADNLGKLRVFQEAAAQSVQGGGEPGDGDRQEGPTRPEHAVCFAQRLDAVRTVRQVVERAQQDHCIRRRCAPGQRAGVADFRARQGGFRLASRRLPGQLDMQRGNVDEVDLIPARGQPAGVTAGPTADVEDHGRCRGQKASQQLAGAFAIELASALVQPVGFVTRGIVGGDRLGLRGMGVVTTGHPFLPGMSAF